MTEKELKKTEELVGLKGMCYSTIQYYYDVIFSIRECLKDRSLVPTESREDLVKALSLSLIGNEYMMYLFSIDKEELMQAQKKLRKHWRKIYEQ